MSTCPHCFHPWEGHGEAGVHFAPPCHCGCLWRWPTPPEPLPPPPTPRQELLAVLCDTMWSAFEAQHDGDGVFTPYVDRHMDMIDGVVDMGAVAEAVLARLESPEIPSVEVVFE